MRNNPFRLITFTLCLPYLAAVDRAVIDELEEAYIERFGNFPNFLLDEWEALTEWEKEPGQKELKKYGARAHKASGRGDIVIDQVVVEMYRLVFVNEMYRPRDVRTLSYNVNGTQFYLTQGAEADCVFYLDEVKSVELFVSIREEACGVEPLPKYEPLPKVNRAIYP